MKESLRKGKEKIVEPPRVSKNTKFIKKKNFYTFTVTFPHLVLYLLYFLMLYY